MIYKIDSNSPIEKINKDFLRACTVGDLEKVIFLLNSPHIPIRANIHYQDDDCLIRACEHGHTHIVKYLLTSLDLDEHVDISLYNYLGFVIACENNQLELVKYFLTEFTFSQKIDVETYSGIAFVEIAKRGHLEIVKFLFSEYEFRQDITEKSLDICFYNACIHKNYDIVSYFIYVLNYPEEKILHYLDENPNNEIYLILEKRKVNHQLNSNLNSKNEESIELIKI